jgi:hypothetical protein
MAVEVDPIYISDGQFSFGGNFGKKERSIK